MLIVEHIPALQVLIPLFGAIVASIVNKLKIVQVVTMIVVLADLILSIYGLCMLNGEIYYNFGSWQAPIGIEYRLDRISQPIIVYINFVLLFCLICVCRLIADSCLSFIATKRQHLFYALLLFAHTGYIGIVSTNDLFNLYVFLEISSLSTYVLMAQGNNKMAVIGALDYLMLGSIGATLILIGIGFLLVATASLNMSDIRQILHNLHDAKIIMAGISFILVGSLLKIAFFPMHFWMRRAYMSTPPSVLIYLAGISTIIGSYICIRFLYYVIDYTQVIAIISYIIKPLYLLAIILCAWFAYCSTSIKDIIIYGVATQTAYVLLLLTINANQPPLLLYQFLFIDGINKAALFLLVAYIENTVQSMEAATRSKLTTHWYILISLTLIFSSGLPLSPMFIVKLQLLDLLLSNGKLVDFTIVIIASVFSLLYHYKIAQLLFFTDRTLHASASPTAYYLLIALQSGLLIIL